MSEVFLFASMTAEQHGEIRCVSLWQPWASLIAVGLKHVETRSWPAPKTILGQRIGIHAAKTPKGLIVAAQQKELWDMCLESLPWDAAGDLPRGFIVATAVVESCFPTDVLQPDLYGDYSPGRFGWMLTGIEVLPKPVPAKGRQGIFSARI